MKIVLVTPDEPFYLSDNIQYLLENLIKNKHEIVSCILLHPSPYGRRETFFSKAFKVCDIFGLRFFIYYSLNYLISKIFKRSVKTVLKINQIPIECLDRPINHQSSLDLIDGHGPDIIISVLGNEIFKRDLLELPSFGCINLHSSLLPDYKGVMPSFWVLLNREKFTGVSVFRMDEGIDSGPIICQHQIPIEEGTTQKDLIVKTKEIGMKLIIESVEKIRRGNIEYIDNPKDGGTYYSFPTKAEVRRFLAQGQRFF